MVRRKRLAKNILVFALALCMIFSSAQPTLTVKAEEVTSEDAAAAEVPTNKTDADTADTEESSEENSEDGEQSADADYPDGESGNTDEGEEGDDSTDENSLSEGTEEQTQEETSENGEPAEEEADGEEDSTGDTEDIAVSFAYNGYVTQLTGLETQVVADVEAGNAVAKIGSTTYETLFAAIAAVTDNTETTIMLLANVTEDVAISNEQNIILDLGSHTLTGTITVSSSNALTIQNGSIVVDAQAGIVIESSTTVTLNGVSITVQGATGSHRAGIYVKDGDAVTLTLEGTNSITGKDLPTITKNASTDVIGIWIGGTPSDSSASNGGASLTITGSGSLSINKVGTGISNTATNSLTISGTTVTMTDIYMLDSTVSGMGIYNNGTLTISNSAALTITNVNNDNLSGTYISYKNGYGIASQNEGGVTITGSGTTVTITGAYLSGVYCSDKTDSDTDNYLTVSDGARLTIDGGSTSTASQHAGIKMENYGTVFVTGGAVINVYSTIYGIAVNTSCLVEVDGSGSQINIHDLATQGEKQNKEQGIYAGANTIINVKNYGDLSVEGANYAIVFEVGTSENDGIFVTDNGTLNITNSDLGIYVQGGTTSVEFTDQADVNIDVNSVAIGSDANAPTGHILMSGEGTTVDLNGDWVFSMNYKYLKIADSAVVNVTATSEAISLGSWKNDGGNLIVTSGAKLTMTIEGDYSGIATYGTSHYVEVSDGAEVYISGTGYGMSLSKPTTVYVSDATLVIGNENGIVASGTGNLLYEDSLSHIEATNVYTTGDGGLDFIVMGGTLTYDFNHENNVWPYNATGITIGDFADGAFDVNAVAPVRIIGYTSDEALVNFIVPSDAEHLTFDAVYQTLTNTYSYQSDAEKEGDTLSIWVPGVEVYYNFDENTDLTSTNLTRKYVNDLEDQGVVFELLYEDVTEPYDMVIRGQSIEFSAKSVTEDTITLKYARQKDDNIVDHVLTDADGISALYTTDYVTTAGETYSIQWYYGNTILFGTDDAIDNGPLTAFGSTSSVIRLAVANVYGILSTTDPSTPGETNVDVSKSKEATQLELQEDGTLTSEVTLSLPSAEEELVTDVVFVLDKSTSTDVVENIIAMLAELEKQVASTNASVKVGVVIFNAEASVVTDGLVDLEDNYNAIVNAVLSGQGSGTNLHAGLLAGKALLDEDIEVDADRKYLIVVSDGITYMYDQEGTATVPLYYWMNDNSPYYSADPYAWKFEYGREDYIPLSWETWLSEVGAILENETTSEAAYSDAKTYTTLYKETKEYVDGAVNASNLNSSQYTTNIDRALYYCYQVYTAAQAEGYNCYVVDKGTSTSYSWGPSFMDYLAGGDTYQVSDIEREVLYLLGAGSTVVDVIGYGTYEDGEEYNFDFADGAEYLTLYVGDTEYMTGVSKATLDENETSRYIFSCDGVTADNDAEAPFVLHYYANGTNGVSEECFVWDINVNISNFERVQLTYLVVLDARDETGTYGKYDRYGDYGYDGLFTNKEATLYPVDSDGNEGNPEDFQKPTVSYAVINVTKTWDDADDQDGKRPDSITVRLLADGEEVDSVEITEADGWTYRFVLPAEDDEGNAITYAITEDAVAGYSTTYDGYAITNSYTPGQTSVTVTKAWNDSNNLDQIRPDSVTVKLLKNGTETGDTLTLSSSNKWTGSFTGLDEYTDGTANVYTVAEVAVTGYTATVTGGASTGFTITNTHTATTTETEDPGDTTDPETTETVAEDPVEVQEAESTVIAEVVSAVTGDNAPIGIAILLAAISEIALITLIILQMRKKNDEVI